MILPILILHYLLTTPMGMESSGSWVRDLTTTYPDSVQVDSLPNSRWVQLFNDSLTQLPEMYLEEAIILEENGNWSGQPDQRTAYWKKLKEQVGRIVSFRSLYQVTVEPGLTFETGSFTGQTGRNFQQFIIWRKEGGQTLRELEFVVESSGNIGNATALSAARANWMKYCNNHDVDGLVRQLYFDKALYYNQRRLIQGTAAIIEQYKYMKDPGYRLTLIPKLLQPVNDSLIFELGQCEGSYTGPYALIWARRNGSEWKIMFDSN